MQPVRAVYEDGVFKPRGVVNLPDHAEVLLRAEVMGEDEATERAELSPDAEPEGRALQEMKNPALRDVYAALSFRFDSGTGDLSSRHDEHEP